MTKHNNKTNWVLLLSLPVLIVIILFIVGSNNRKLANGVTEPDIYAEIPTELQATDTDGDGLSDNKERLFGTDINNPDTDGDGASDGDEIDLSRNPLIAGPNDDLLTSVNLVTPEISESELLEMRDEYLRGYLADRGEEVKEITFEYLINKVDETEFDDNYTIEDISISHENTTESFKKYGNELGAIFLKYGNSEEYSTGEVEVLENALRTQDPKDLVELKLISGIYKNLSEDILAVKAPYGAANLHLMLVNGYDVLARTISAMAYLFTEPLRGGFANEVYTKQLGVIKLAFINLMGFFDTREVKFEESDSGWMFDTDIIVKKLEEQTN